MRIGREKHCLEVHDADLFGSGFGDVHMALACAICWKER
jgi:hypothetical protein